MEVKTLRITLEAWREIIITIYSILQWEKQFYPAILAGVVTFVYVLLWWIDPAVLTLVAFIGITITLADFFIPQIVPYIFGTNSWTGADERKYELAISTIVSHVEMTSKVVSTLKEMKMNKPKTFFCVVVSGLIISAWIGSAINNLFLTYLITLIALLLPGLRKQEGIKQHFEMIESKLRSICESFFGKTGEKGQKIE